MISAEGAEERARKVLQNIRIQNEDKHQIEVETEIAFRRLY